MSAPNINESNDARTADIPTSEQRPAKRRRAILVCDACRVKKSRCDGERPVCGACQKRQTSCLYAGQKSNASDTQRYIDSLKARNYLLEQQLAGQSNNSQTFPYPQFTADRGTSSPTSSSLLPRPNGRDSFLTQHSSMHRTSPFASQVAEPIASTLDYQQSSNAPGRERQSDDNPLVHSRHATDGELGRASNAQDISHHAPAAGPTEQSSEYFGEPSTFDFMAKVCTPGRDTSKDPTITAQRQGPGSAATSLAISSPSAPIFDGYLLGIGGDELFGLPTRFVADRLVDAYFKFTHPLNTYLHEYTFRRRYERLWLREDLGGEKAVEDNLAWFGLVNLIFAFGSDHTKAVGGILIDNARFFKCAKALVFSSLFQAATIDLVQALLLMGQYLNSSLELDNSWTVVGLAIRMAQSLGLHLNATTSSLEAVDQEVRKRVWWGCFVIDRLLSIKVGRPPIIHDGPHITIKFPLPIDDEYLTNDGEGSPIQPSGIPSKFAFLTHVITQCRLLERICNTLYSGRQEDVSKQGLTDIPKLLAMSIQLDGDLVAWQQTLPPHLQFDSRVPGWEFERQRSTLLMRFLNSRLLIHRQILLIFVTRQCPDSFQRQIIYPCIQRCVMAAHDTISQVRILSQRRLLHPWWHNTHSVFTALCVMLAFKMLGPQGKAEVGLLDSVDINQVIYQGTQLLQEVGEQCHPLASRYLHWFQKLERKLPTLSLGRANNPNCNPAHVAAPTLEKQAQAQPEDAHNSFPGYINDNFVMDEQQPNGDYLMISSDELFEIENMFFSTGWDEPVKN